MIYIHMKDILDMVIVFKKQNANIKKDFLEANVWIVFIVMIVKIVFLISCGKKFKKWKDVDIL